MADPFPSPDDELADQVRRDDQERGKQADEPGGDVQGRDVEDAAAEGNEHELQHEDGAHDQAEAPVLLNMLEDIQVLGAGIEAVESDAWDYNKRVSKG